MSPSGKVFDCSRAASAYPMTMAQSEPRTLRLVPLAIGLALLIAAARVAATLYAMPEAPYYDQWAGMDGIAVPRAMQAFNPGYLLQPHNEHLLTWTKLLDWLQLVAADNQYDSRPVGVLLAVLSAIVAGVLLASGAGQLNKGRNAWLCAGVALAAIPYSWESLSATWNNAFTFLIAGSVATLWLATCGSRRQAVWTTVAAMLSALAMGTGCLAPLLGIGIVGYRAVRRDLPTADAFALAVPQAAAVMVALLLLVGKTRSDYARLFDIALIAVQVTLLTAAFAPTASMLVQIVGGKSDDRAQRRVDLFVVALATWGYLHVLSMIVLRSEFRLWLPISRYMDVIAVAIMANLACLLRLDGTGPSRLLSRFAVPAVALFAVAIVLAAPLPLHYLQWRAERMARGEALLVATVRENDTTAIARADASILPFPDRVYLERHLADENVRSILGDRTGNRVQPASFVRGSRTIERMLADHSLVLSLVTLVIASMLLVFACRRREEVGT